MGSRERERERERERKVENRDRRPPPVIIETEIGREMNHEMLLN